MSVKDVLELRYELRGELLLAEVVAGLDDERHVALAWDLLERTLDSELFTDLRVGLVPEHPAGSKLAAVVLLLVHYRGGGGRIVREQA